MSSIGGGDIIRDNPYDDVDASKPASGGYPAVGGGGATSSSGGVPALPAAPATRAGSGPWSFNPYLPGSIDLGIGIGGKRSPQPEGFGEGFPLPGPNIGLGLGLPKYDEQGSSRLKTLAQATTGGLEEAAKKNTSGPEAKLLAWTKAAQADALRSIEADEAKARKLPLDGPERRALEDGIDARVRRFENDLTLETLRTADAIKARAGGGGGASALDRFKGMLPPYLRECIEKEGVVIPGVPGSFKPRTDNGTFGGPTGLDYKVDLP